MKRFLAGLMAVLLAGPAWAAPAQVPTVFDTSGRAIPATPVLSVQTDGTAVSASAPLPITCITGCSGGAGGGGAVYGNNAAGTAATQPPVLVAGQDGAAVRSILTDSAGQVIIAGRQVAGQSTQSSMVVVGGTDGTNVRQLKTTSSGALQMIGDSATGSTTAAIGGLMVGGSDGTNYRHLRTATDGTLFIQGTGVSNSLNIAGNIAAGTTDSTNPVKVGGVYNSTLPTYTTGQRGDVQLSPRGSLMAAPTLQLAGGSDAVSNTLIGRYSGEGSYSSQLLAGEAAHIFNGTSWDRQRTITAFGDNGGATGVAAVGTMLFDGTNWNRQRGDTTGTWITGPSGGPLPVAATVSNPTSTLTRPATTPTYGTSTLVASSATAGSVVVPSITLGRTSGGSFRVSTLRLASNHTTGLSGASFTVDLWRAAPTFTNGDTGAYAPATTGAGANFLGSFSGSCRQFADGAACVLTSDAGFAKSIKLSATTLAYWSLRSDTGFTAQSGKTFTLEAEEEQD